jgi:hypothetical protein
MRSNSNSNRYKRRGWFGESHRHYLAAKGIKTRKYFARPVGSNRGPVSVRSSTAFGASIEGGLTRLGRVDADIRRLDAARRARLLSTDVGGVGAISAERSRALVRDPSPAERAVVIDRLKQSAKLYEDARPLPRSQLYRIWQPATHGLNALLRLESARDKFQSKVDDLELKGEASLTPQEFRRIADLNSRIEEIESRIVGQKKLLNTYRSDEAINSAPPEVRAVFNAQVLREDPSIKRSILNVERKERRDRRIVS